MKTLSLILIPFLCLMCKPSEKKPAIPTANFAAYARWVGCYGYSETPVKALAGYSMVMLWNLQLTPNGRCYLSIDGQQSMVRILCMVSPIQNGIEIRHFADGKENQFPTIEQKQTLFRLVRNGPQLLTDFAAMKPRLSEPSYKPGKRSHSLATPALITSSPLNKCPQNGV